MRSGFAEDQTLSANCFTATLAKCAKCETTFLTHLNPHVITTSHGLRNCPICKIFNAPPITFTFWQIIRKLIFRTVESFNFL